MDAARLIEIIGRDVHDPQVLRAMAAVPRDRFVPASMQDQAWENHPLPIGEGQTISQPLIVALMTEALQIRPGDRVLEIGTGSGYQAAVLAECGAEVFTVEVLPDLADRARSVLRQLGYPAIHFRTGNGRAGWPQEAPFDGIIATAAGEGVPQPWLEQLRSWSPDRRGGRLVLPVENGWGQELQLLERQEQGLTTTSLGPVRFVPLT